MADPTKVRLLREGADVWNRWRHQHPDTMADLTEADLTGCNLESAYLYRSDLTLASLRNTNLIDARLYEAIARGTDFTSAQLVGANLMGAQLNSARLNNANLNGAVLVSADLQFGDLSGADLRNSLLTAANFHGAKVTGADFSGCSLGSTVLGNMDLSTAKGLESVVHRGSSSIGIDTIYQSLGKIPETFLRGAGVPEVFIREATSLVAAVSPFEFYSCFISYANFDYDFVSRLHADLTLQGVRCWFAPHDMRAGKKLHEQIDRAIRIHDRLLLILSEHSMNSPWVQTEISKARKREITEKRSVLFPVRLADFDAILKWECMDADSGKDLGREIREYFIPDFSQWTDPLLYKRAFDRLLSALKEETGLSKVATS